MGRLSLRLPESLHRQLSTEARAEGVSLNQYLVYLLAGRNDTPYAVEAVPSSEVAEQIAAYGDLRCALGPPSESVTRRFLRDRQPVEPEPDLDPLLARRLLDRARNPR